MSIRDIARNGLLQEACRGNVQEGPQPREVSAEHLGELPKSFAPLLANLQKAVMRAQQHAKGLRRAGAGGTEDATLAQKIVLPEVLKLQRHVEIVVKQLKSMR